MKILVTELKPQDKVISHGQEYVVDWVEERSQGLIELFMHVERERYISHVAHTYVPNSMLEVLR